ncbi:MAG: acyl-CoA dehydrogenase family protein [Burkholderiaceae bacterium]|nr:acyl-CoA dehydrogenase family protein [Burkholderiaceae bacterium]
MAIYHAPVEDYRFLLHDWLRVHERADLPGFAELTPELTQPVIDAAARFFETELHPIHQRADDEGAALVDGRVRTPAGFREAWQRYSEAGWQRLTVDAALGGEGLPPVLGVPNDEMGIACGHAFMMYGAFCPSAAQMLAALGDDWMKAHVVPALVAGRWTATMCLTEPHCGTDLRQLRTRAVAQPDGSWRISGSKIFISGGDHDLTEAIAHIVLAKVPDAQGRIAPGLGSVNVFLVPSCRLDPASGALGGRNAIEVGSIERKMGIGASATCVLNFDEAVGWRIAAAGQGSSANMAAMFMMMNHARVATAMSGVAYADIAYQNARAYARERLSGRAAAGPRCPDRVADPLIVHPDVRRLLLDARAFAQGGRATALRVAFWQSVAAHGRDRAERERAQDLVELLTPVMKAYFTDKGFTAANDGLQVFGGHGYVCDSGMEHFVRNARIGQIYEGANGIQAMDLVGRKLPAHGGRALRSFEAALGESLGALAGQPELAGFGAALAAGLGELRRALAALQRHAASHPDAAGAAAYDLLNMFGILAVGWSWADLAAVPGAGAPRLQLARVWFHREMPLLAALRARIEAGPDALCAWAEDGI